VADDDDGSPDEAIVEIGDELTCEAPVDGFDRFEEQASERGIDLYMDPLDREPCVPLSGVVVAEDLDQDGDVDALLSNNEGFPTLFANDGEGRFDVVDVDHDVAGTWGRAVHGHAVADLNGDRLPEVLVWGPGMVLVSYNQGGLAFSDFEALHWAEGYPHACIYSLALGDADADGDIDLFVPRGDLLEDEDSVWVIEPESGTPDLLLLNEDGQFTDSMELQSQGGAAIALLAVFTDRDNDGDADLLVPSDRPFPPLGPTAFHRNEGGLQFEDDAVAVGADLYISGMGLAANDLNGDGLLDYVITDLEPKLVCLASSPGGAYFDAGLAWGMESHPGDHPDYSSSSWDGWSVELVDLDNDGALDMAVAAGSPEDESRPVRPDALFQGDIVGDQVQFTDRSAETGFNLGAEHYGLVAADFDGDGHRDVLIAAREGPAVFWNNPCGQGAWLEIELHGPAGNTFGIGARVTTRWGDGRVDVQEIQGPRGLGQSPAAVHVGLRTDEATSIEVRWPDGVVTTVDHVPTRRKVAIHHPDVP